MDTTKQVYVYSYVPKLHSLYSEIINHPPKGYTYLVESSKIDSSWKRFYTSKTVKDFAFWQLNRVVDTVRIREKIYTHKKLPAHDLLYSTGYLCLRKEPWVVDMEFPSSFTGYSLERFEKRKNFIAKTLMSSHCKRIIPWSEAASDVMRNVFKEKEIQEKIRTVPLVVSGKQRVWTDRKDGLIRIFFIGSSNLPNDFEIKGGCELLEAYKHILSKYDNVELVIRCFVPAEVKQKYHSLPRLRIIEDILPKEELEKLYTNADIFIGIAHYTPGVALLEAMSYGLPVIATDVWENARIVTKNEGILIPKHSTAPYFAKYGMPNWGFPEFMAAIQRNDPVRIEALKTAMCTLIENEKLRRKMGRMGRYRVESGPYSIEARNKLLKEIYDDATG